MGSGRFEFHAITRQPSIFRSLLARAASRTALPILFGSTLFVSAALVFAVQPMFARMVLPLLGGTPAVWTTCMLFFQATLLAGYGYAHLTARWLPLRPQAGVHALLLLVPLFMLPVAVPAGWVPPSQGSPVSWLLSCLVVALGFPLFVVSATTPLLQEWFAHTSHPAGRDPYFLYAASNLGSLAALLAYPTVLEPRLRLAEQSWLWAGGYWLLTALVAGCGVSLWRSTALADREAARWLPPLTGHSGTTSVSVERLSPSQRVRWVALSFVPSSLMLGLTTYLTVDISPMPLLWVGPLAIYLLTFVLVFSRRRLVSHALMARALPVFVLPLVVTMSAQAVGPLWLLVALHVATFFLAAMVCHGELAKSRPPAAHLTAFYLWMSAGGVLGGVFNALLAPVVFQGVVEYPLAIVLACLLLPSPALRRRRPPDRWLAAAVPLALGGVTVALAWVARASSAPTLLTRTVTYGVPALLCFAWRDRPAVFALGLGATMLATTLVSGQGGDVLHRERSFFGVHRVTLDTERGYRALWNGTTLHGSQSIDPAREREPLAYYHRAGPLGQVFATLSGAGPGLNVAIVGLGTGSMACYGEPGQHFVFYEIDPAVERIARDPRYFTFLRICPPRIEVVLGDARRSLGGASDRRYRVIVLDAFSSDAIPTHLLTREALRLYCAKLADGGILAFHISNRRLDLEPVLAGLARDAGLVGLARHELRVTEAEERAGKTGSEWAVMARRIDDLGSLSRTAGWRPLTWRPLGGTWSDDFSNTVALIRWR